jgi:3-phenylpropionate/trans-cinnamate dioxygenase ferredoxin reductase component
MRGVQAGPLVIVGAGLTGGNAAVTLREEGHRGRVVLIGDEPGMPFGRPPLSKTYLRGEEGLHGWYVRPAGWYAERDVEVLGGERVATVDAAAREVVLESGGAVPYEALLLATGGRNRSPGVPGAGLPGVHQLRTVAEADAIRAAASPGGRAVVVGMGFIGCEVAASLRQLGMRVTAILRDDIPLKAVLGPDVGSVVTAIHEQEGVELRTRDRAVAFEGDGRLERVVTAAGARLPCDLAVVGIGIEPVFPAVTGAELATWGGGIAVDELCRTSVPDVYAAGDVASHLHPLFGRVRVEHYNNAEKHGRAAARSMLGSDEPSAYLHTFWSDQYRHKLEYAGHAASWDGFTLRGSLEERRFLAFYLEAGVLRAAAGFDRGGDPELEADSEMAAAARLIAARARVPAAVLADESVGLGSLLPG